MGAMDIRNTINLLEANSSDELKLQPLDYSLTDLEPVMSKETIDIHYNTLTKNYFKKAKTGDEFQIAGAFLHGLLWDNLQPYSNDNKPTGKILDFIKEYYGTFAKFKSEFEECATTIHGNGWAALTKSGKCVQIPNHKKRQDIVLLVDMWEHAMLDYNFNKTEYIKNVWNIINWNTIENRLDL